MRTAMWGTLREAFHRRIALALIIISLLVPVIYIWWTPIQQTPKGPVVLLRGNPVPAAEYTTQTLGALLSVASGLWVLLGLIAAAPLLTSPFEKGWAELLLSKGVARWRILAGRVVGASLVFVVTSFLMDMVPALYVKVRAGVPIRSFCWALALVLLGYLASLSIMALLAITRLGSAALIVIIVGQSIVSTTLAHRSDLYRLIGWKWVHPVIEWVDRILPKTSELEQMAMKYFATGQFTGWFPVWSTALFVICALGFASWGLARKSF